MGLQVRSRLLFLIAAFLLAPFGTARADDWLSLQTPNFLVIGDASAGEIKRVALRLEQFNGAIPTAFPGLIGRQPTAPAVVVVFKDAKSFEPYLPREDGRPLQLGAYLFAESDVNYMTMRSDGREPDAVRAYYLFAALQIRRLMPGAPPWFIEGVAQYVSSFELDGTDARIGKPIRPFVDRLRSAPMTLAELFSVRDEGVFGQSDRRALFLAKSWFLIHYASMGKPERFGQLLRFVNLVRRGEPVEKSFGDAFGFDFARLDGELGEYLQRSSILYQVVPLGRGMPTSVPEPKRLTDVEAQVWKADLLAHESGREEQAAALLQDALSKSPDLALAHASLGMLRMRRGMISDAVPHLQQATAADVRNPYVLYYYAVSLRRLGRAGQQPSDDDRQKAVAALTRALELSPNFSQAEREWGFHLLSTDLTTAREVLRRALDDAPGDRQTMLLLAQADLRLGRVAEARQLLGPLAAQNGDAAVKQEALALLTASSPPPAGGIGAGTSTAGVVGGVIGGLPEPPPPPPSGFPSGGGPIRVGGAVQVDVSNFCCPEYLSQMITLIQRNWQSNQGTSGSVLMRFTITRAGAIENVQVEQPSGFLAHELAAQRALLLTRLPELPIQFPNANLTVHMRFEYQR